MMMTLVAAGVAGIVALAISQMLGRQFMATSSVSSKIDRDFAKLAALHALQNIDCEKTFPKLRNTRNFAIIGSRGNTLLAAKAKVGDWRILTRLRKIGNSGNYRFSVGISANGKVDPLTKKRIKTINLMDLDGDGRHDYSICSHRLMPKLPEVASDPKAAPRLLDCREFRFDPGHWTTVHNMRRAETNLQEGIVSAFSTCPTGKTCSQPIYTGTSPEIDSGVNRMSGDGGSEITYFPGRIYCRLVLDRQP